MKLKISVIVPFRNEEANIARCAESLLNQHFPSEDYEIIFIDNCSSDRSTEVLNKYSNIKLLSETLRSSYAARNKGISIAQGEIIAFIDCDCIADPDWLANLWGFFIQQKADIQLGYVRFLKNSCMLKLFENYENRKFQKFFTMASKKFLAAHTNNMAVKKELFKIFGQFEEIKRGGDALFVQKVIANKPESILVFNPLAIVAHLEIRGVLSLFKKYFIYGRASSLIRQKSIYRPVPIDLKTKIVIKIIKNKNYGIFRNISFLILLLVGQTMYLMGEMENSFLNKIIGDK